LENQLIYRFLVEGYDDNYVVKDLLKYHEQDFFSIKVKGGVEKLVTSLKEEIKATDLKALGVILDADKCLSNTWDRIKGILKNVNCVNVPNEPSSGGTIVKTSHGQKIGVWLMPDNQHPGMLEDFISSMIPESDCLWAKAQNDVEKIPEKCRRFKRNYLSKAMVHTWLAWQEEPGTRMGQTFTKRCLDPECEQALSFVNWVKRLLD
jgi:hypothetical protein